jgi:hypothetical protein
VDALDAKVIGNLMSAMSIAILILIDELEKEHPGLKSSYAKVLAEVLANEEAKTRRNAQAITVLRGMLKGVQRKSTGPRTVH